MESDEFVAQFIEWVEEYQIDDILNMFKNQNCSNVKDALLSIKSLDLSRKGFLSIPKYLFALSSLETLNLSHNQLTELPKKIIKLQKLQVLDISWNHITHDINFLPTSITVNKSWNRK